MRGARRPSAVWGALFAALAAGSGCAGSVGSSGSSDPGAGGAGQPGNPGMGPGGAPVNELCRIDLTAASPLSFDGLSAGPDAVLKVRGDVTGTLIAATYRFEWTVVFADGTLVPFTKPTPAENLIQFSLDQPGSYTVLARLDGGRLCQGERTVVVARTGARLRSFRFRATPPAGVRLPAQDVFIQVLGGTPSGGNRLQVARGIEVVLEVRRAEDGVFIPAYVRVTDDVGVVFEGRSGRSGQVLIAHLPTGVYQTLVVPDGDIAPLLLPPMSATQLSQMTSQGLTLDAGIAVDGVVQNADGSPLPDSKVILRAGTLASTLAVTDAKGAFRLRARPGQFAGTVSPPVALGMMRAEVPVTTGVTIPDAASTPPTLGFRLRPFRTARLALALSGAPDSLTGETRVVVESMAPIADVATLSVGTLNHTLAARIHGELTPNAEGMVVASTLPRGRYKVTIYPAGGANAVDAVTTVSDIEVGGGGGGGGGGTASPTTEPPPQRVTLARKVNLRGSLLPGADAAGIEVVAVDVDSLLPLAFVKRVVAGGTWEMAVNPARTYTLRALPQPGQRFARASFGRVSVAAGDLSVAAQNMPDALLYSGTVVDPALQGLEGVLLQMFCVAGTPDCADPTIPVAETVSGPVGAFQLMLPDPGAATP